MTTDMPKLAQIPDLRRLWQQAFGDTEEFLDSFFSMAFARERCRCITVEDRLVAALYWFDCNWEGRKAAYVYAVATDSAYQGKGYCRTLLEDTHSTLKKQGYALALLVPGEEGLFRLYEKCGYKSFCPMEQKMLRAGEKAVPFRQVTVSEYAAAQKKYAPLGSVLHLVSSLAFGSGFLKFYAGEDFAFCCAKEETTADFQEFLGNAEKIPGILAGLGAETGKVRLPGKKDYAMYDSLEKAGSAPKYFGIPFN